MKPQRRTGWLTIALTATLALGAAELRADSCNWAFQALADIWEMPLGDQMTSYHFSEVVNVDCTNSRSIALKATVLHNNATVHNKNYVGGPAVQGQYLIKNLSFGCSLESWRASSKAGTRYLGIYVWYDSDNSPIFYPGCDCPDDDGTGGGGGGGFTPTEVAVVDGETRVAAAGDLRLPPLTHDRWSHLDGFTYAIDEWAVVDGARVLGTSSPEFGTMAHGRASALGVGRGPQLIVEAPIHPANQRWIARPSIALERRASARELPRSLRAFARLEFGPAGELLEARLLHTRRDLLAVEAALLLAELQERVSLVYASSGRHRSAAFLDLRTDSRRELEILDGIVVLHRCRCGPE